MYNSADVTWTLVAAFLVFFMQAGFALCEAGLTRAKNTGNILMKNMMDFCIGTPCYWLVGFGIMFAGSGALIGGFDPFIQGSYDFGTLPVWVYAVFQTVFCATAATIVSGSMAERTKFSAYCCYSAAISLIVYPISGHWIWGGGWLAQLGFHDFAGSTAVHFVGGVTACLGAWMLGPRIGKYNKAGKARAIPGHNLTAMALGVFILWFCWFGFNGGSTVSMTGDDTMVSAGLICFNTNLAAALATVAALIVSWVRYGKPDVSLTFNGALAGLVAITAGCDVVDPFGAAIIGIVAGVLCIFSVEFFDNVAKIDDPVGAVSVHCMNGAWGTIAVGLFATEGGLFYGGGFAKLGIQLLGIVSVAAWVLATMFIIFTVIKKTIGLRVSEKEEIDGLDYHEHGLASAYAGFAINDPTYAELDVNENTDLGEDDITMASPEKVAAAVKVVKDTPLPAELDSGMHKVSIIVQLAKFETLKKALNDIGVTGMTVTQVMGCGLQKGSGEKYRGAEVDATLLPKVKVEVVVSKIPVDKIIDTATNWAAENLVKGAVEQLTPQAPVYPRHWRVWLTIVVPTTKPDDEEVREKVLTARRAISAVLEQAGLFMGVWDADVLVGTASEILNAQLVRSGDFVRPSANPFEPPSVQVMKADTEVTVEKHRIRFETLDRKSAVHAVGLGVEHYGGHISLALTSQMLGELGRGGHQIPCPFLFTCIIAVLDSASERVKAEGHRMRALQMSHTPVSQISP